MLRATFAFSMHHHVCWLEIDALSRDDAEGPSLELAFKVKASERHQFELMHIGRVRGYSIWSEAPLALLLRALHLLRVEWFSSIPQVLVGRPVLDLSLSVVPLSQNPTNGSPLAVLSLKKVGLDDGFCFVQSLPNRAMLSMSIDHRSAVPLEVAVKVVEAAQLETVDLRSIPRSVSQQLLTDRNGQTQILREQIPYYAVAPFDAFRAERSLRSNLTDALVPVEHWRTFLSA
ncbi:hypothetical protein [Duganella sp. S19_KUP01_CR8]|uniref:hypothetical protein n=1 Tax=Duganella sp. S19_KUP01_CR8 TaxID=3025502 RepID=UPI002FCDBD4A